MSAAAVLTACRMAGVSVWVEGERLRFSSAAPLPETLIADLRANKPELMALLSPLAANESEVATRDLDADGLEHWLRDEGLCLVLRGAELIFTGADGRLDGRPSKALAAHVTAHREAILTILDLSKA